MNKFKKLLLASSILVATGAANAGYTVNTSDTDAVSFGGFIKIDARNVNGEVAYRDFWLGAGLAAGTAGESTSKTRMFANESRFNMKYTHGDVMGFIELDFWGGGGNEIISNSANPRIRHAFIKYDKFVVGQTWTTFMNTSALAETLDFAGPIMGGVFGRQAQVRYTNGGLQVSLENPYSDKGDSASEVPDLIAKYTFKGDWGNVSAAALVRQLNTVGGESESSFGYSIAGRIKTVGQDDFRFQYSGGEVGRYVGAVSGRDLVGEDVEETDSYLVAYRHFWSEGLRSTLTYGTAEADISGLESSQVSLNLMKSLTKQLTIGVEVGNYEANNNDSRVDIDSDYLQLSLKYVL